MLRIPSITSFIATVLLAAACTPGGTSTPTSSGSEPAGIVTTTPASSSASPALPEGLPPSFENDVSAADVPAAALIPLRAEVTGAWSGVTSAGEAIVVAWAFPGADPLRLERGVAAWRRFADGGGPWRPVWGIAMPKRSGTLGVDAIIADITGDSSDDVLLLAATGGSGSCFSATGIDLASGEVVFSRPEMCDAQIVPGSGGGLHVTEAVFGAEDPHCCPSQVRTTSLRYAGGQEWAVVDEQITDL